MLSNSVMVFLLVLSICLPQLILEETLSYIWDEYYQSLGVHQAPCPATSSQRPVALFALMP